MQSVFCGWTLLSALVLRFLDAMCCLCCLFVGERDNNCRRLYGGCCLAVPRSPGFRQFKVYICFLIFTVCVRFHLVLQTWRLLESCTLSGDFVFMRFERFSIMLLEHITIRLERTNGWSLSTCLELHSQKQNARRRLPQR